MKELKSTGFLLLVMLLLYGYMAVYEDHTQDDLDGPKLLNHVRAKHFTEVKIWRRQKPESEEEHFTLTRTGAAVKDKPAVGWQLSLDGRKFATDVTPINSLIRRIGDMQVARTVDSEGAEDKVFGLDRPRVRVSFKAPGAEEDQFRSGTFEVGGRSPVGALRYVRVAGKPQIYAAENWKINVLMQAGDHFRDKRILPKVDSEDLTLLEIISAEETRKLVLEDGDWWMIEPRRFLVDPSEVHSLLSDLNGLRAKAFLGNADSATFAAEGLGPPQLRVRVGAKDGVAGEFEVGTLRQNKGNRVSIRIPNDPDRIEVDADLLERLKLPLEKFRDRVILRGRLNDVQRLRLRWGETTREYARVGGPWASLDVPQIDIQEQIKAFLNSLGLVQAKTFVDTPGPLLTYGLASPEATLEVWSAGKYLKIEASMVGEKAGPWLRMEEEGTVYRTQDARFFDRLTTLFEATQTASETVTAATTAP